MGLAAVSPNIAISNTVLMYTTIPILDSDMTTLPWVDLDPPMHLPEMHPIHALQFFQCSQSLVNQTASVNTQSTLVTAVEPDIQKYKSTWLPYNGPPSADINGTLVEMVRSFCGFTVRTHHLIILVGTVAQQPRLVDDQLP
jgi:hypothetical protein